MDITNSERPEQPGPPAATSSPSSPSSPSLPSPTFSAQLSPPPSILPTPPLSPGSRLHHLKASESRGVVSSDAANNTTPSADAHREYLDSLVPPSRGEFARIAEVQTQREAELKRRSRDIHRQSLDADNRPDQDSQPEPHSRLRPGAHHASLSSRLGFHRRKPRDDGDGVRAKAATIIQRNYRGYRVRREMKGLGIDASTRWIYAVREAQWRELNKPRARLDGLADNDPLSRPPTQDGSFFSGRSSSARQNWKKASVIARRAGGDPDADSTSSSSSDSDSDSSSSSSSSDAEKQRAEQKKLARKRREEAKARRRKEAKMMGLQYFLEMVDLKHRYGSNLRVYHQEWKRAETNENFFYWLDYGEGRFVDMEACSREQLDREQVRYLSREERQYYLVKVDEEGRLCWAKNGARIDTTEKWKDSIHGIVPTDDPTPAYQPISENPTRLLGDSSTDSGSDSDSLSSSAPSSSRSRPHSALPPADSTLEVTGTTRKADDPKSPSKPGKKIKHISASTLVDSLLRKSVRKNTWIFVADTSFRLYVGIKNSGAFQHSSFLQGSRISAAGLIKIKDGRLSSLSPLSGHYRPPASNFRAFVHSLKEEGVDTSHVSISKSYAVLVGLETYIKVKKKGRDIVGKVLRREEKMVAPEAFRKREEEDRDKSQSAAREVEVLKEEEEMRVENGAAVHMMQKMGIARAGEPKGQKGEGEGSTG